LNAFKNLRVTQDRDKLHYSTKADETLHPAKSCPAIFLIPISLPCRFDYSRFGNEPGRWWGSHIAPVSSTFLKVWDRNHQANKKTNLGGAVPNSGALRSFERHNRNGETVVRMIDEFPISPHRGGLCFIALGLSNVEEYASKNPTEFVMVANCARWLSN
jgi:hypothetical protein